MFNRTRRIARPIVALPRKPGPKHPLPECTPSSAAIGPCTIRSGATGCVVAWTPYRLNEGSSMASTAATISGNAPGSQPAITALTASFSSVANRQSGGITPSDRSPGAPPSIARTRASVGGTIGQPSHHCRSPPAASTAAGVSGAVLLVVAGNVRPAWTDGGRGAGLPGSGRAISPVSPVLLLIG